jgi:hypothetical protein
VMIALPAVGQHIGSPSRIRRAVAIPSADPFGKLQ